MPAGRGELLEMLCSFQSLFLGWQKIPELTERQAHSLQGRLITFQNLVRKFFQCENQKSSTDHNLDITVMH